MRTERWALALVGLVACRDARELIPARGLAAEAGVVGVDRRLVPPSCGPGRAIIVGPAGDFGCDEPRTRASALAADLVTVERAIEATAARLATFERPASPPTLSLAASTCTVTAPSELRSGWVRQSGPWVRWARGGPTPLTVVCAVPALAEAPGWSRLEAIVDDPDGPGPAASIEVSLRAVTLDAPDHVATLAANSAPVAGPTTVSVAFAPELELSTRAYYVQIDLRTDGSGDAPGIAGIRLRAD